MNQEISLLGVDYRTAPADVREGLRFSVVEAGELQARARERIPDLEAVILSTCYRTEFYLSAPDLVSAERTWMELLRETRPQASVMGAGCLLYRETERSAVRHLLRVACGLESAVLGDAQILGQVREAKRVASAHGTLGKILGRAFSLALKAGRKARGQTVIGRGAASVGSALSGMVLDWVQRGSPGFQPKVLIVGAGEIARDSGRCLAKKGITDLSFINRTEKRSGELAIHCGGKNLSWDKLEEAVRDSDVVIAATSSPVPLISFKWLKKGQLVIDAGLPRNVEPSQRAEVLNIDSIRERQGDALAARQGAVPAVEGIVDQELKNWERWAALLPLEEKIKILYLSVAAFSRKAGEFWAQKNPQEAPKIERKVQKELKGLLHKPIRDLRQAVAVGDHHEE
jgi:glutamyl-tRNA reductase